MMEARMGDPLALRILQTVSNQKPVPLDYLTFKLGASRSDIEQSVRHLQTQGAVDLVGDKVQLAGVESNRSSTAVE
jgi:hypothetical protein